MFFCAPNFLFQVQLALGEKKKLLIEALENVKILDWINRTSLKRFVAGGKGQMSHSTFQMEKTGGVAT